MPRKANKNKKKKKYRKQTIPKAIREQTWLQTFGKCYEHKCYINWCENEVSVFDFHVGHDKPESKGGNLDVSNLIILDVSSSYAKSSARFKFI